MPLLAVRYGTTTEQRGGWLEPETLAADASRARTRHPGIVPGEADTPRTIREAVRAKRGRLIVSSSLRSFSGAGNVCKPAIRRGLLSCCRHAGSCILQGSKELRSTDIAAAAGQSPTTLGLALRPVRRKIRRVGRLGCSAQGKDTTMLHGQLCCQNLPWKTRRGRVPLRSCAVVRPKKFWLVAPRKTVARAGRLCMSGMSGILAQKGAMLRGQGFHPGSYALGHAQHMPKMRKPRSARMLGSQSQTAQRPLKLGGRVRMSADSSTIYWTLLMDAAAAGNHVGKSSEKFTDLSCACARRKLG